MINTQRGTHEIVSDILKVARNGAKKSHMVYRANMNFKQINKYLKSILTGGLMDQTGGIYTTTKKGINYINQFQKLNGMCK